MNRIYFGAADGRIKIGITSRGVRVRLKDISAHLSTPLELIGDIPGSRLLERTIHEELAEFRLKGEWFRDCVGIRIMIADILKNPPLPLSSRAQKIELEQRERTPEEYGLMISKLANLVWPNDAVRGVAAFTGLSESECREWFAGTGLPSELIRYGLGARIVEWIMAKHAEERAARG